MGEFGPQLESPTRVKVPNSEGPGTADPDSYKDPFRRQCEVATRSGSWTGLGRSDGGGRYKKTLSVSAELPRVHNIAEAVTTRVNALAMIKSLGTN